MLETHWHAGQGDERIPILMNLDTPCLQDEDILQETFCRLVGPEVRLSTSIIQNMPGEGEHAHVVSDVYLVYEMVDVNGIGDSDDESERAVAELSIAQCLSVISVLKRFIDSRDLLSD